MAAEVRVAVASNFKPAMVQLVPAFEAQSGHAVSVSYASTGKHFAQITNGAPFDVFLAADSRAPGLLEESGRAVSGTRFTYARGSLVLWVGDSQLQGDGIDILRGGEFRFLAIANPRTAPYGQAAEQFLRRIGLWEELQGRLVRGENVAQAFAFVRTGNAQLGLLAQSQALQSGLEDSGRAWLVPQDFYDPMDQQAVLLTENQAASEFTAFLRTREARQIITANGYTIP